MSLIQAVSTARVEIHRLHKVLNDITTQSKQNQSLAEALYEEVGDTLMALPDRVRAIETSLDRASLLLISDMEGLLRSGMPISDLSMIEDTSKKEASQRENHLVWSGRRVAGLMWGYGRFPNRVPAGVLRGLCGEGSPGFEVTQLYRLPGRSRLARFVVMGRTEDADSR